MGVRILANFYIADLHIGHAKVIEFDQRPFADMNGCSMGMCI